MTDGKRPLPEPERATPEQLLAHAAWVRGLARALVGRSSSADDVAQDAWLAALRHPPSADRPVRPWLARVVAHVAQNRGRSERRRADHEGRIGDERETPKPDELAASFEMQRLLLDEVERLDEPHRSTLARFYFHGVPAAAIARQDHVSESTVRARLSQAVEALRRKLDERHHGLRASWMALITPLARHEHGAHVGALATVTGTLFVMSTLVKVGVAALVLVLGVAVYAVTSSRSVAPGTRAAGIAQDRPARLASMPDIDEGAQEPARVGLSKPASPPVPASIGPDDAVLETHVVDEHRQPVQGAILTCWATGSGVPTERVAGIPAAESDAGGNVRIAVRFADLPLVQQAGEPPSESFWTTLTCFAPGHARAVVDVTFAKGKVKRLSEIALAAGGDVTGRVVDGAGQGVGDALVRLFDPRITLAELEQVRRFGMPRGTTMFQVRTSADGSFSMRGVKAEGYRVWTMPGARLCAVSEAFDVRAGGRVEVPTLIVEDDPAAITGTVLAPDGTPCVDAEISTPGHDARNGRGSRSCKDGRFVHKALPGETVDLEVEHPSGVAIVSGVRAGTRDLRVVVSPQRWMDVHVRDRSGAPLGAFSVGIDEPGRGGGTWGTKDQKDGTRHLRVPLHPFTLTAFADGYVQQKTDLIDPATAPAELVFELESMPMVRGRVVLGDEGVAGADVLMQRVLRADEPLTINGVVTNVDPFNDVQETMTEHDGSFAFTCRKSDTYVLSASRSEFASGETRPIAIDSRHPPTDVVIALSPGGTLAGNVLTQPGDESTFPWVQVVRPAQDVRSVANVPGGAFRFDHLEPGTWWIRRCDDAMFSGKTGRSNGKSDPTARAVQIVEGQVTHFDLDVRAQPSPVLFGRVTLSDAKLDGWVARITIKDSWASSGADQPIAADGTFVLRLLVTGKRQLVVVSPTADGRSARIEADVPIVFGSNSWSLDVPTGWLTITPGKATRGVLSCVCEVPGGARSVTDFTVSDAAPIELEHIPAGRATIVDEHGDTIVPAFDVPAHDRAHVTLP